MLYDDDDGAEEINGDLCEWCHARKVEEQRMVIGLGFLRLCKECSLLLLSSLMDAG